jgi:hypothetical protein
VVTRSHGLTGCLAGVNQRRLLAIILATAKVPRISVMTQYHKAASFSPATEVQKRKINRSKNCSRTILTMIMATLDARE